MRQPLAPTARSSSRSSKRSDASADARGAGSSSQGAVVAVGEIVAAHALRGWVRVRPYHVPAPSLVAGRTIELDGPGGGRTVHITAATPHGRALVLLALREVTDRTAAEKLVGARVLVDHADLPPPDEGEFYYHEVEGFRVETSAGVPLGAIASTFATGVNDVWVVQGSGREHLIPVIADVVRTIDRRARRVVIEPLPGLLDG